MTPSCSPRATRAPKPAASLLRAGFCAPRAKPENPQLCSQGHRALLLFQREDNTGMLCLHLQVPHFPALAVLMMQSSSELMATCLTLWNMPLFGGEQAVPPPTLSQAFHTPSLLRVQPSWGIGKEKPVNLYPSRSPALLQTPGPAAFPKIEVDTYKRRAPIYTMGAQTRIGGDRTIKPGPADYRTGKVRQPARLSCSVFQRAAFKHLPLLLRLQRTNGLLTAGTSCRTAGLLPAPDPSRGRAEDTAFPFHSLRPYTRLAHPSPSVRVELGDTLQIHGEGNPAKARLGESSGSRAGPAELAMPDGITVLSAQFPFAHKSFS